YASAAGDLLAVGAASDAPALGGLTSANIYFGIATATNWTTPQNSVIDFQIEIDTNADGVADFTLSNQDSSNDIFIPVLTVAGSGTRIADGLLNVFAANLRDTAPFNNSVLVLPVKAASLGLTSSNSRFQYRVLTSGSAQSGSLPVDSTAWIWFDATQP